MCSAARARVHRSLALGCEFFERPVRRTGDAATRLWPQRVLRMERGAGGGAGERTLEQAFEQCVSGGRALEQDVRTMRERGTRARTGVQAARNPGRERVCVSEGGPDTSHRTAHACMRSSNSDISQIWRARDCICPRVSLSTGRTAARVAV